MDAPASRRRAARIVAPLLTLLGASLGGALFGVQVVVLTLAAAALLLVIWLLWSSVQALAGQTELSFEEAFNLGARSSGEEQKRAVLRALKDLEYERSVGKISEQDFLEYSARYRSEAKRLIQALDENLAEGRRRVELELERRRAKIDVSGARDGGSNSNGRDRQEEEAAPDGATATGESSGSLADGRGPSSDPLPASTLVCPECQAKNDGDARFCKACGNALARAAEDNP